VTLRKDNNTGPNRAVKVWNSRGAGITAGIVLALVFLVVAAAAIMGIVKPADRDTADAPASASSTAPSRPTTTPGAQAARFCQVSSGDRSTTPTPPADLTWTAGEAGLSWPVSPTVGPTKSSHGFGACFAQSPIGAALAGTNAMFSQWAGHGAAAAYEFYIAAGAGKAASVNGIRQHPSPADDVRDLGLAAAGYQVNSYTPTRAVVTVVLASPGSSTGYIGAPLTMVWTGDDWRVEVLADGAWFAGDAAQLATGQFTPWSAS
jgi:hypothetical protein